MLGSSISTILLGTFSGVLGGALGQSGAETILPGLLILGIVPDFKTAAGTTLLTILPPLSLLAIIQYYKRGQVQIMTGVILMISYFFAAYVGALMTKNVENSMLELIAGVYFIIIGLFFIWNSYTGTYGESSSNKHIKLVSHSSGFRNIIEYFHGK
jgi:uncharacterized membrane protein YfcA